jgi:small-conductance mechanosensitive channel
MAPAVRPSFAVRLGIWDRFQAHDIAMPFPQREVRLKGPPLAAD